jgi:hypothetical protein
VVDATPDEMNQHMTMYVPLAVEGSMHSPSDTCLSPSHFYISSFLLEAMFEKMINYTLMVTLAAFVLILLLIRQMEYSSSQAVSENFDLC